MQKFNASLLSRILAVVAVAFFYNSSTAQEFWGMTTDGGDNGVGTIFSITTGGAYTKQFDFPKTEGGLPKGSFYTASSGIVYGVTELGGVNGGGILFEYDPNSGDVIVLHNFDSSTGSQPIRGLVEGSNGKLYGTCSVGGTNNWGVLYEFDQGTATYTAKVHFTGPGGNGSSPQSQLYTHSNGTIYGTCWTGGTSNFGTLFSYIPGAGGVSTLHHFSIATGARPFAGVTEDGTKLIGTAQLGGTNGNGGVIYSYDLNTSTYAVLYNLGGIDGATPLAPIESSNGVYYGTASTGGDLSQGVLFSYDPGTTTYQKLVDFSASNGTTPIGGVLAANDGKLYGMTSKGGTNDDGVLYSYDIGTSMFSVVYQLTTSGLEGAWGNLIQLSDGSLTGMTKDGGAGGSGAAFRYVIGGLFDHNANYGYSQAGRPAGRLLAASDGLYYGTTSIGGNTDEGVIFSYNPANGLFATVFNFGGSAYGGFPEGTLTELNGFLFGTCRLGGSSSGGTIFKYNLNNGTYTKLANLNSVLGTEPVGKATLANNGLLYVTTTLGGTTGDGTILEVNPSSNSVTKVHDFDGTNGSIPFADLFLASNGSLYGTTAEGGTTDEGTLFEFTTAGAFSKLVDFDSPIGALPYGKLTELGGTLYGTSSAGASISFAGGIYSWDIANSTYTQEANFNLSNADNSRSELVADQNGNLWGTGRAGGSGPVNGYGTVYRFNPITVGINQMHDYIMPVGGIRPTNGLIFVQPQTTVSMGIKVILQGPYDGSSLMGDAIRSLAQFPTNEPYAGLGFSHYGEGGGESISASVLNTSGSNAIVDWILVELRDKNNSGTIVNTRAALVQRDGDIVDLDGSSALQMAVASDNYYVSVRHRNHLGVMSAGTVALSTTSTTNIDFSSTGTSTYGTNAQVDVNGTMALWAGNVNPDGVLKYTGANNDRDPILVKVGGSVPTSTAVDYSTEDVNLDAIIKYTGSNNDRDPVLVNIGGSVPTATRIEQLP